MPSESPPIECNVINDVSVGSKLSEDFSELIPANENIKLYLMKGDTCDIRSCNSKTFDFGNNFYKLDKLELMNEKLKSQVMIYDSIHKNILTNEYMSWHLWIKDLLSDEVEENYNRFIDDENRPAKTYFFIITRRRFPQIKCQSFLHVKHKR